MIFLKEREVGYANDAIGFPSIQGCIALVYQMSSSIFGFHNAGNSGSDRFDARAKKWSDYIRAHAHGADAGVCLYGVTFARNNERGYSNVPVSSWRAELKTFATRLAFTGPLMGHDLSLSVAEPGTKPSAYVEFKKEGNGYSIFARVWHNDARDGVVSGTYAATADYKNLDSTTMTKMVTGVDRSALIRVYAERLGGL